MSEDRALLDAFADARRTWDDLISLQPDIRSGAGHLTRYDLIELSQRLDAHRSAIDVLWDALQTAPETPDAMLPRQSTHTGISNRESAAYEAEERRAHPPSATDSPAPEDAAGRVGEQPLTDTRDRHTSHKAGSRSIAQKQAESRYPDRSMPASRKVAGAFGREPKS
jgi:hypothetical protein